MNKSIFIIENISLILNFNNFLRLKKEINLIEVRVSSFSEIKENYFIPTLYIIETEVIQIEDISRLVKVLTSCKVVILINDFSKYREVVLNSKEAIDKIEIISSQELTKHNIIEYIKQVEIEYSLKLEESRYSEIYNSIKKYLKTENLNLILSSIPILLVSSVDIDMLSSVEIKKYKIIHNYTELLYSFLCSRKLNEEYFKLLNYWLNIKEFDLIEIAQIALSYLIKASFNEKSLITYFDSLFIQFKDIKDVSLLKFSFELSNNYISIQENPIFGIQKLLNNLIQKDDVSSK